jgi:hypothetical protein
MKLRPLVLAGGVGVAAWLALFGDKTPVATIAEPVTRTGAKAPAIQATPRPVPMPEKAIAAKATSAPDILALRAREELIGGAHAASTANALFASQNWNPPPPPSVKPAPPPPPSAPPLPFTYLGKKVEDGAWEVYVARGDQTYILREQSVIDGAYRVDSIKPPTLSVMYMPLNQIQTLTIGGTE